MKTAHLAPRDASPVQRETVLPDSIYSPLEAFHRTWSFYQANAAAYAATTAGLDLSEERNRFQSLLGAHSRILDAGCGSGRDSVAFTKRGMRVKAIDAASNLVAIARAAGADATVKAFQQVDYVRKFDGIWACASLLHVPAVEMSAVLRRLGGALRRNGAMFVSLKEGRGESLSRDGRYFSRFTPAQFAAMADATGLRVAERWEDTQEPAAAPWMRFILRRA